MGVVDIQHEHDVVGRVPARRVLNNLCVQPRGLTGGNYVEVADLFPTNALGLSSASTTSRRRRRTCFCWPASSSRRSSPACPASTTRRSSSDSGTRLTLHQRLELQKLVGIVFVDRSPLREVFDAWEDTDRDLGLVLVLLAVDATNSGLGLTVRAHIQIKRGGAKTFSPPDPRLPNNHLLSTDRRGGVNHFKGRTLSHSPCFSVETAHATATSYN